MHWHSDILKQKMLLRLYTPLQNWLLRRAKVIVGTTPVYVKESPFLENIQRKVTSIPIGIDEMKPIPERVAQIKERYAGKKIIFSLGRLVEYKGYEYLIQAARRLTDDYVILIGGRGPLQEYLQALIDELGVADRVKLLGFIEDDDLPDYFGACDLFCLSSILKTGSFRNCTDRSDVLWKAGDCHEHTGIGSQLGESKQLLRNQRKTGGCGGTGGSDINRSD